MGAHFVLSIEMKKKNYVFAVRRCSLLGEVKAFACGVVSWVSLIYYVVGLYYILYNIFVGQVHLRV